MDTAWKVLENYSKYRIYKDGRVLSIYSNKFMRPQITKDGYYKVSLIGDDGVRKTLSVHRLVSSAYIPNLESKETVNHKDGDKDNNHRDNLEWATRSEQTQHAWDNNLIKNLEKRKQGIRSKQGKPVKCLNTGEVFNCLMAACEKYRIKKSNLSSVCLKKVGYKSAGKLNVGVL